MIKVVGLTKKYGNRKALNNISFDVDKGEIVGFLGPNGAGKSTTMNILTGYISASSGSVKIDGIDILSDPINAKKKIGYLPETPPLYMDMTVSEYLNFVFELKKIKLHRQTHIQEICDLVKISDISERIIKNLSKGYKQRVGLAQALIGNPEILILDEPTVGLDPKQIIEIRNLIKELGKRHTVILSSHILSEIQAICNKVIIINNGTIVANSKIEDISLVVSPDRRLSLDIIGDKSIVYDIISNFKEVEKVFFERNGEVSSFIIHLKNDKDIRKELSKAVTESGATIVGLKLLTLSLEEAFLRLTEVSSESEKSEEIDDCNDDIQKYDEQEIANTTINNKGVDK